MFESLFRKIEIGKGSFFIGKRDYNSPIYHKKKSKNDHRQKKTFT